LRNYRLKIMTVAFLGTHIPLIALVAYVALQSAADWKAFLVTLSVALAATLIGTGFTLLILDHLLRPILATGRTLRNYRSDRRIDPLPTHYGDEAGRLMADAHETLRQLDCSLDALEFNDAQTRLPNRKRLAKDVAGKLAGGESFALCAIRLAAHGRLAETVSLETAEAAAAEVAARLVAAAPLGGFYRIGAADFILLAAQLDAPALQAELERILQASSGGIATSTGAVEPGLRAGVALAPADADEAETLIDHAVAAAAMTSESRTASFHSPAARAAARERLRLEQEIRRALARDEFVLHYQPVVDLGSRRTVGAEALIRWAHPERGLIPPAKFIPAAETSGLIDEIGLWVLRRACAQIKDWRGGETGPLRIAVNLSARQFLDADLTAHVRRAIDEAAVPADALEIELTETAAMVDYEYTRLAFRKLRDLGVSIAIDDFGTGFASLSHLRRLPFNKLKIDREFVTDVNVRRESQAICRALVGLGAGLGLNVLAEGVETADEVTYLQSLGCQLYQGYVFAKPLPVEDFESGAQIAALKAAEIALKRLPPESRAALAG
jgi:EAL domain-containing protein (putative c-di-GMP-specific phosphodiesterase class I)/GGDEF domain-containing protein